MKKTIAIILGVATTTVLLLLAALRFPRKPRRLEIRANDLGYQESSPEKLFRSTCWT